MSAYDIGIVMLCLFVAVIFLEFALGMVPHEDDD